MVFKINGTAKLEFQGVEIEARSEEEAKKKFLDAYFGANGLNYLLSDAVDGVAIEDLTIDEDGVILDEATYVVKAKRIDYDISEDDLDLDASDDLSDDSIEEKIEAAKADLPQDVVVEFTSSPDMFDDYLVDAVSTSTGMLINSIDDYEILETK